MKTLYHTAPRGDCFPATANQLLGHLPSLGNVSGAASRGFVAQVAALSMGVSPGAVSYRECTGVCTRLSRPGVVAIGGIRAELRWAVPRTSETEPASKASSRV